MKLTRLELRNFKGAVKVDLHPQGKDLNVYGDNAAGKTTLADAWFWLLFGKDSFNRATFQIKPLDSDGNVDPAQESSVFAEVVTEDGPVSLTKVYREVWVRKRAGATLEFESNTTDHFVDSVPMQKRMYDIKVGNLCEEKQFRLLTDPQYFNVVLKWQERREILMAVCGDISDAEVIATNEKLADLPERMGKHSLDDFRAIVINTGKAINKELKELPARIDEVRRGLPEIAGPVAGVKGDISRHRAAVAALTERRATINAGGAIAEKTVVLRQIEGELQRIANELRSGGGDARSAALAERSRVDRQFQDAQADERTLRDRIRRQQGDNERLSGAVQRLRELNAAEKAKTYSGESTCPTCGQELPSERVEAAIAAFNQQKSQRLEEIQTEGRAKKATLEEDTKTVENWIVEADRLREEAARLILVRDAIEIPAANVVDLNANPAYAAKLAEKEAAELEIAQLRVGERNGLTEVDEQISTAQAELQASERALAQFSAREAGEARIVELEAREKDLGAQFEDLQRSLWLTEEFVRTKTTLLTDRINSKFKHARFKLFEEQVNGGLKEACEVTYNGVPYSSLNHGAKLNVGLDVINVLGEHFGFTPPIFIDNAESVTSILPTHGQQIRLIVSAQDQTLRIEPATRAARAQEALIS